MLLYRAPIMSQYFSSNLRVTTRCLLALFYQMTLTESYKNLLKFVAERSNFEENRFKRFWEFHFFVLMPFPSHCSSVVYLNMNEDEFGSWMIIVNCLILYSQMFHLMEVVRKSNYCKKKDRNSSSETRKGRNQQRKKYTKNKSHK